MIQINEPLFYQAAIQFRENVICGSHKEPIHDYWKAPLQGVIFLSLAVGGIVELVTKTALAILLFLPMACVAVYDSRLAYKILNLINPSPIATVSKVCQLVVIAFRGLSFEMSYQSNIQDIYHFIENQHTETCRILNQYSFDCPNQLHQELPVLMNYCLRNNRVEIIDYIIEHPRIIDSQLRPLAQAIRRGDEQAFSRTLAQYPQQVSQVHAIWLGHLAIRYYPETALLTLLPEIGINLNPTTDPQRGILIGLFQFAISQNKHHFIRSFLLLPQLTHTYYESLVRELPDSSFRDPGIQNVILEKVALVNSQIFKTNMIEVALQKNAPQDFIRNLLGATPALSQEETQNLFEISLRSGREDLYGMFLEAGAHIDGSVATREPLTRTHFPLHIVLGWIRPQGSFVGNLVRGGRLHWEPPRMERPYFMTDKTPAVADSIEPLCRDIFETLQFIVKQRLLFFYGAARFNPTPDEFFSREEGASPSLHLAGFWTAYAMSQKVPLSTLMDTRVPITIFWGGPPSIRDLTTRSDHLRTLVRNSMALAIESITGRVPTEVQLELNDETLDSVAVGVFNAFRDYTLHEAGGLAWRRRRAAIFGLCDESNWT